MLKKKYQNFLNKINKGIGIEYAFMLVILVNMTATLFAVLIYLMKEVETKRLARDIHSALIIDYNWINRYSELGQYDNNENDFKESILSFLLHTKELSEEYGANIFLLYMMNDDRYIVKKHINLEDNPIYTDKTLVNKDEITVDGKVIPAGCGVILNDNNLWYITEDEELECIKEFDFYNYRDLFYDNDLNYNINIDNISNNQTKEFFSIYRFFSKL